MSENIGGFFGGGGGFSDALSPCDNIHVDYVDYVAGTCIVQSPKVSHHVTWVERGMMWSSLISVYGNRLPIKYFRFDQAM